MYLMWFSFCFSDHSSALDLPPSLFFPLKLELPPMQADAKTEALKCTLQ